MRDSPLALFIYVAPPAATFASQMHIVYALLRIGDARVGETAADRLGRRKLRPYLTMTRLTQYNINEATCCVCIAVSTQTGATMH